MSGDIVRWASLYMLMLAYRGAFSAFAAAAAEAEPELHTSLVAAATRALYCVARELNTAAALSPEAQHWLTAADHVAGVAARLLTYGAVRPRRTACCELAVAAAAAAVPAARLTAAAWGSDPAGARVTDVMGLLEALFTDKAVLRHAAATPACGPQLFGAAGHLLGVLGEAAGGGGAAGREKRAGMA